MRDLLHVCVNLANYLERGTRMMPLHRYVNQKPDDDNDPYSESGFTLYMYIRQF